MLGWFSFLWLLSFIGVVGLAIMVVVFAVRRKPKKRIAVALIADTVLCVALFVFICVNSPPRPQVTGTAAVGSKENIEPSAEPTPSPPAAIAPPESSALPQKEILVQEISTPEPSNAPTPDISVSVSTSEPPTAETPEPAPTNTLEPAIPALIFTSGESVPVLYENVSAVEPYPFSVEGINYQIIGCAFGSMDSNVEMGLNTDDGLGMAFTIGLHIGASDFGNKDALLAIYYSAVPGSGISSPRDVPLVDFDIAVCDDRGDDGLLVINTLSDEAPVINTPIYGMALFGVYSDASYFDIDIGGETVRLESASLPYKE